MEHLQSPDGKLTVRFDIADDGEKRDIYRQCPLWSVSCGERPVLLPSRLGLELDGEPSLLTHFTVTGTTRQSNDSTWEPVCGEYSQIRDHYNELEVTLRESIRPHRELRVAFRAFDSGAAFRYILPENGTAGEVDIWKEATRFTLPAGCAGWATRFAQGEYERKAIEDLGGECERPLLLHYADGSWAAIGEAGQYDYPRMRLQTDPRRPHTIAALLNGSIRRKPPFSTPWRYVIVGDRAIDIPQRNSLSLNLAPPCRIPGSWRIFSGNSTQTGRWRRFPWPCPGIRAIRAWHGCGGTSSGTTRMW